MSGIEKLALGASYGAGLLAATLVARFCWSHGANIPQGLAIAIPCAFTVWIGFNLVIDALSHHTERKGT